MKKNFKYAILSAIALVGAVSLTSCSSSDDVIDNPDFNPEDNTVKTQFTFSISKASSKSTTRQTSDIVQDVQTQASFRGMTKMSLIPFASSPGGGSNPLGPVIGPLSMKALSGEGSDPTFNNDDNNAVVYTNITVPTTTSHFLFYGQAKESGSKAVNGALTVAGLYGSEDSYIFTTPQNVTFTPVGIYNDQQSTAKTQVGTDVIALLNSLLSTTDNGEITGNKWSAYTDGTLEQAQLKDLYEAYIDLTTGSSYSVAAMLVDLYASLGGLTQTADGTNGKTMAAALRTAIAAGFDGEVTEANFKKSGYPGNLGLPDGAAKLTFNDTNEEFSLSADPNNTGNYPINPAGSITVTSYTDYVYPANLQYFVKSDIVTSAQQQSGNFDGKTTWAQCCALYNGTSVSATTKSVALTKEIQYGVGNLKIIVNKLLKEAENPTKYYDSKGEVIDLSETTPFTLTGVLVGGQGQVGWNFTPSAAGSMTIYDNQINSANLGTTTETSVGVPGAQNYTLGLETVDYDSDDQNSVISFALEFQNNTGKDFMGRDGLIPAGGKFYLAGNLDPSHPVEAVTGVRSVFKQDYMTTATITIAPGTLAGDGLSATGGFAEATNGVPDLRTPQSEVCFSINLQWTPGLQFNVEL
jgi:hypothetical protein